MLLIHDSSHCWLRPIEFLRSSRGRQAAIQKFDNHIEKLIDIIEYTTPKRSLDMDEKLVLVANIRNESNSLASEIGSSRQARKFQVGDDADPESTHVAPSANGSFVFELNPAGGE
jgi:hypothetical protein